MEHKANTTSKREIVTYVSEDDLWTVQWVLASVICQAIDVFGTGTNVINIVCFVKQGFKDSVTVSLFGLAISDLICLLSLFLSNLTISPLIQSQELSFDPVECQYITTAWIHVIFTRITSWITAFITLERCLCITMPLKVKIILTPQRSAIIIASLFIILLACGTPWYFAYGLGWKFFPQKNRTLVGLIIFVEREKFEGITFGLNNVIIPYMAFIVIIACTSSLVINLRNKTKWRETSTSDGQAVASSLRDQKVTQMVVVVSALFIACFIPICVAFIGMLCIAGLALDGKYRSILITAGIFGALLESVNSASNIFIYYYMSSKYRAVFRSLFRMCHDLDRHHSNKINHHLEH